MDNDTRRAAIDRLQDWVWKGEILTIDDLVVELKREGLVDDEVTDSEIFDIAFEEVLFPQEMNTCERCGKIEQSENLCWLDYLDLDPNVPEDKQKLDNLMARATFDYCAICWDCYHILTD